ncbi:GntR family transcriptional regulator [Streptomyces sp. NPDC058457]|uniref:GntR family transcriptional regulator n=1 Tax=Streptomyces sp. NPDC058457 TaxID=3346507 RepID=UPI0036699A07
MHTSAAVESVLREQLANGTYRVGQQLPTQRELAGEFGVSRDTVQRVLRRLADEGWIATRQGSGMRVLRVPRAEPAGPSLGRPGTAALGPLLHRAFEQPEVLVDTFTLTSETLWSHLRAQTERVLMGEVGPARLRLRVLLPAETVRPAYPAAKDPDDERVWLRWKAMTRRHATGITDLMAHLRELGVDAGAEFRRVAVTPQCKLYFINDDLLFGLYEPVPRTIVVDDGTPVPAVDVLGLGSVLRHYRGDEEPECPDGRVFAAARAGFDAYWEHLSVSDTGR